jgi:hypothetical protein
MLLSLPSIWAKTAGSAVRTLRCAFFQVTSLDRPITLPRGGEGDEDSCNTRQQQKQQQEQQPPNHTNRPLPIKVLLEHSDGFMVPFVTTSNTEQHHPPTTTIITLHDYHRAFLRSPVFQLEFWILRMCGLISAESVSQDRLDRVAAGTANSFALWSTIYRESSSASSSQTVVMRCTTPSSDGGGTPFVDTWWSLEQPPAPPAMAPPGTATTTTYLVKFGTAMHLPFRNHMVLRWFGPLHRLYSRILLASAVDMLQQQQQQQQHQQQQLHDRQLSKQAT